MQERMPVRVTDRAASSMSKKVSQCSVGLTISKAGPIVV